MTKTKGCGPWSRGTPLYLRSSGISFSVIHRASCVKRLVRPLAETSEPSIPELVCLGRLPPGLGGLGELSGTISPVPTALPPMLAVGALRQLLIGLAMSSVPSPSH